MKKAILLLCFALTLGFASPAGAAQKKGGSKSPKKEAQVQLTPDQEKALGEYKQGLSYQRRERLGQAIQSFEAALKLDPQPLYNLALVKTKAELVRYKAKVAFEKAKDLQAKGDLNGAIEALEAAVLLLPEKTYKEALATAKLTLLQSQAKAEADLAKEQETQGRWEAAIAGYEKAWALSAEKPYQEALARVKASLNRQKAQTIAAQAKIWEEEGKFAEAITAYQEAHQWVADPAYLIGAKKVQASWTHRQAQVELDAAQALVQEAKFAEAIPRIEAALKIEKTKETEALLVQTQKALVHQKAQVELDAAQALVQEAKFAEAIPRIEAALKIEKTKETEALLVQTQKSLVHQKAQVELDAAQALVQEAKFAEAIPRLLAALKIEKTPETETLLVQTQKALVHQKAQAELAAALGLIEAGRYIEGIRRTEASLGLEDQPQAQAQLARAQGLLKAVQAEEFSAQAAQAQAQGQLDLALSRMTKAQELDPKPAYQQGVTRIKALQVKAQAKAAYEAGLVLLNGKKEDWGFKLFEEATTKDPEPTIYLEALALATKDLNRRAELLAAVATRYEAAQDKVNQARLLFGKGLAQLPADPTAAKASFEQAEALDPSRALYPGYVGWAQVALGNLDGAKGAFERALVAPNPAPAAVQAGFAYRLGLRAEEQFEFLTAYGYYKTAQTLDPTKKGYAQGMDRAAKGALRLARRDNETGLHAYDHGDFATSSTHFSKALTTYGSILGEGAKETLAAQSNLASSNLNSSDPGDTLLGFQKSYETRLKTLGPNHIDTLVSANNYGIALGAAKDYNAAEAMLVGNLKARERVLGRTSPQTLQSYNNLAAYYLETEAPLKAAPLTEVALGLAKARYQEAHPDLLTALNNRSATLQTLGEYTKAAPLVDEALELAIQLYGETGLARLVILANRASIHQALGEYEEAHRLYQTTLALTKGHYGEDHPAYVTFLVNEASLYQAEGNGPQAEANYKQALAIKEKVFGPLGPQTLSGLSDLGRLYLALGRYDEAKEPLVKALKLRNQALGPKHPDRLTSLKELGDYYLAVGDANQGLELFQQAYDLTREIFGPQHPATFAALHRVATGYRDKQDWETALKTFTEAYQGRAKVLGKENRDTLESLYQIALVYRVQLNFKEAEKLFLEVAAAQAKILGPSHAKTLLTRASLASLYRRTGKKAEAVALNQTLYEERKRTLGELNLDTLVSLNEWGQSLDENGQPELAIQTLEAGVALAEKISGPKHQNYLNSLNALAGTLSNQRQFTKAKPLYEKARDLALELSGETSIDHLVAINNLANLESEQGGFEQAKTYMEKALVIAKALFGENEAGTVIVMNNLASLYQTIGALDKAKPLFERALELHIALYGKKHLNTIASFNNLANFFLAAGLYDQARPLFTIALNLSEEVSGPKHPNTLSAINNLASLYQSEGRYNEALPLFEQVLDLRTQVLGAQHPDTLASIDALAGAYMAKGLYGKAEPLFLKSLELRKKVLGEDHPQTLASVFNLARLYQAMAAFQKARPLIEQVIGLRTKKLGPEHPDTLAAFAAMAALYQEQGQLDKAEELYLSTLEVQNRVVGAEHPDTLAMADRLVALYQAKKDFPKAQGLAEKTLAARQKVLGPEHPDTIASISTLATLYQIQGRYADAEPHVEKAAQFYEKVMGPDHPSTMVALNNLGFLYQSQGKVDKAREIFAKVYEQSKKVLGSQHPNTLKALNNLAASYQAEGNVKQSLAYWQLSLDSSNQFLEQVLWAADDETRQSYIQMQDKAKAYMLSFYKQNISPEVAREALRYSLARKGMLLKITSEINAVAKSANNPAVRETAERLKSNKQKLAAMVLVGPGKKPPAEFDKEVTGLQETLDKLESELGFMVQQFRRAKTPVAPEAVQRALKPDDALVDFLVFTEVNPKSREVIGSTAMAIVVTGDKDKPFGLVSLGDFEQLQDWIKAMREQIVEPVGPDQIKDLWEVSAGVYDLVWKPLEPYLKGKKRVFLVPDGPLYLLPFNALRKGDSYLIENYQLIYVSSSRDLAVPSLVAEPGKSVIFAAPNYQEANKAMVAEAHERADSGEKGAFSSLEFDPLPGTEIEAKRLTQLFSKRQIVPTVFAEALATETNLKNVKAPRILHLATHGYFLPTEAKPIESGSELQSAKKPEDTKVKPVTNPMLRAGLALSSANYGFQGVTREDGSDGVLTALEALNLDLVGTDLVVLSACETGVGDVKQGEGVYGLGRAFQEAGAKSVSTTLWTISDDATADFMDHFYARFLAGANAQTAMWETQKEFLKSPYRSHPFFWSPFVLYGNP